jgi:hypothetical protein
MKSFYENRNFFSRLWYRLTHSNREKVELGAGFAKLHKDNRVDGLDPSPVYEGEVITGFDAKHYSEFPNPSVFPPPQGDTTKSGCGCLFTAWHDPRGGMVRLETIWQPLWSTVDIPASLEEQHGGGDEGTAVINFFTDSAPSYHHVSRSNMSQPGSLPWPKKFTIWEVEFTLSDSPEALGIVGGVGREMTVGLFIGEKAHLKVPFSALFKRTSKAHCYVAPLPLSLYLPSEQYVMVELRGSSDLAIKKGTIRCQLNGYLHRELP